MTTSSPLPPPTCAHAEVHGLLLLPPLDAGVLLLQGVDVRVHPLHHHAVDGRLVLRLGSAHRAWAQLGDVALLRSLLCGGEGGERVLDGVHQQLFTFLRD